MIRRIEYIEDKDIVLLKTSGTYELEAEVETLKKMASKLREHNCGKCIFDHRETNVIARTMKSYERPGIYEELWGDHTIRAAVVFREIDEDAKFLENVCRNRGWNVKIFEDYDIAIDWLSE